MATAAAGQASGQYHLADPQPPAGLHYYRLGLRRPDGSTDYAAPTPSSSATDAADAQVFPNPVGGDYLQLTYSAATSGNLQLHFYDELGRDYGSQVAAVQTGLNVLTLPVSGLLPGFYLLAAYQ